MDQEEGALDNCVDITHRNYIWTDQAKQQNQ